MTELINSILYSQLRQIAKFDEIIREVKAEIEVREQRAAFKPIGHQKAS